MPKYDAFFIDRFWSKVNRKADHECWEWTAYRNPRGYGSISSPFGRTPLAAHRASWILTYGEIPSGLHVLHKCDNPPCVNPGHLFIGTPADNVADKVRKDRANNPHTKLTRTKVAAIRERLAAGERTRTLARKLNLDASTVRAIRDGVTWRHIPVPEIAPPPAYRGTENCQSKLTPDLVRLVRQRIAAGDQQNAIAAELNASPATICDIKKGRTWAWLKD